MYYFQHLACFLLLLSSAPASGREKASFKPGSGCGITTPVKLATSMATAEGSDCVLIQEQDYSEFLRAPPTGSTVALDEDGQWAEWSTWSPCSATCGQSNRSRSRSCTNPAPSGDGIPCVGDEIESEACTVPDCLACPDVGTEIVGSSVVLQISATTAEDCQLACQAEHDCLFWALDASTSQCSLLPDAISVNVNPVVTSGEKICPHGCPVDLYFDYPNNDFNTFPTPTFDSCRDGCIAEPACQYISFNVDGLCYMKDANTGKTAKSSFISWAKNCE